MNIWTNKHPSVEIRLTVTKFENIKEMETIRYQSYTTQIHTRKNTNRTTNLKYEDPKHQNSENRPFQSRVSRSL